MSKNVRDLEIRVRGHSVIETGTVGRSCNRGFLLVLFSNLVPKMHCF